MELGQKTTLTVSQGLDDLRTKHDQLTQDIRDDRLAQRQLQVENDRRIRGNYVGDLKIAHEARLESEKRAREDLHRVEAERRAEADRRMAVLFLAIVLVAAAYLLADSILGGRA